MPLFRVVKFFRPPPVRPSSLIFFPPPVHNFRPCSGELAFFVSQPRFKCSTSFPRPPHFGIRFPPFFYSENLSLFFSPFYSIPYFPLSYPPRSSLRPRYQVFSLSFSPKKYTLLPISFLASLSLRDLVICNYFYSYSSPPVYMPRRFVASSPMSFLLGGCLFFSGVVFLSPPPFHMFSVLKN